MCLTPPSTLIHHPNRAPCQDFEQGYLGLKNTPLIGPRTPNPKPQTLPQGPRIGSHFTFLTFDEGLGEAAG